MKILDISRKSNQALEKEHDWVQQAFPTTKASSVAGSTYQLTEADVQAMRKDPELKVIQERNTERFLAFMKSAPGTITKGFNHNYQRVTRVLESLVTFGNSRLAVRFYGELVREFSERGIALPDSDRNYWRPALRGTPSLAGTSPRTGLPPRDEVPEVIGIGLGESARFVAKALNGEAMPGDVATIHMEPTEAVISPANTKGDMGGMIRGANIDAAYLKMFGAQIQDRVQARIRELYGSDTMPLGEAFMIRTYPEGTPIPPGRPGWLIVAPTIAWQSVGTPKATPDLAGKALEAALALAGDTGMTRVYVPAMGMGSTVGADDMQGAFRQAFADAYDKVDMYLYDRHLERATPKIGHSEPGAGLMAGP